jgi:hypothetical protein
VNCDVCPGQQLPQAFGGQRAFLRRVEQSGQSAHCDLGMGRARDMRNNGNQHHKINAETEAEYIEPLLLNHVAAAGP